MAETYHRFADEVAFIAACDATGLPLRPDGKALPPAGVVFDVVGPAVEPPVFTGTLIKPVAVDPRWHVSASWFAASEVNPEPPE